MFPCHLDKETAPTVNRKNDHTGYCHFLKASFNIIGRVRQELRKYTET